MADTDLIERLNVHAASWRCEGAFDARDAEAEAAIAEEAAAALSECNSRIAELEAAPSPSPAPGVVEALTTARSHIITLGGNPHPHDLDADQIQIAVIAVIDAALASLSQPAKGEREGEQP